MTNKRHFERLEHMYHDIELSQRLETIATISEGNATITMPVKEEFFHAANAMHGMYYFKMLDDAAFFAANSLVEDVFVLTSQFNLYFLRPVSSGTLRAEGTVVSKGGSRIIADAIVYDDQDIQIGRGSGTFVRSNIKLEDDIGYVR